MRRRVPNEVGIAAVLVLVVVAFSILSPNFRTLENAQVLLLNGAVIAFLALGQTFVLLTGGIDLSTGSNVALTGMIAALTMRAGLPWWSAILVAIATGLVVGAINGALIYYLKLPPFIVTFATFGVAASIPLILTGASSVNVMDSFFAIVGRGSIYGVPMPVILVIVAAIIFGFVLRFTATGVHIYAVGGNAETSRLAGVNSGRVILLAYALSGLCAAMGGLIVTSRLMVGYPSAGSGNELFYSIAAAVVGGVSLFGGIGSISGALLGAVLIATVSNGMNVIGVQSYWQPLVIGLIILAGVIIDTHRRQLSFATLISRLRRTPNSDFGSGQRSAAPALAESGSSDTPTKAVR